MRILSTHYLRRRADARAKQIRRWQEESVRPGRPEGGPHPRDRLRSLGIERDTPVTVRKRGKWDARYDVVAP